MFDENVMRLGQGKRGIEDAVSYALGHRIRVEILARLNEGTYTPEELARFVRQPLNRVGHHIKELLDGGSIELASIETVRNMTRHYYRAISMPFFDDEAVASMTPEERKAISGVTLQAAFAEAMASFWAGKMQEDPRMWLAWRWFNVDRQGRHDLADGQARFWDHCQEVEAESTGRSLECGEETVSVIVTSLGYLRAHNVPTPPDGSVQEPD